MLGLRLEKQNIQQIHIGKTNIKAVKLPLNVYYGRKSTEFKYFREIAKNIIVSKHSHEEKVMVSHFRELVSFLLNFQFLSLIHPSSEKTNVRPSNITHLANTFNHSAHSKQNHSHANATKTVTG